MKILQLFKDFLLPAFWLFFFIAYSGNTKSEAGKKHEEVKSQEKLSTSSAVIKTAQNKNTSIELLR